jgi:hypothetical protein
VKPKPSIRLEKDMWLVLEYVGKRDEKDGSTNKAGAPKARENAVSI